MELASLLDDGQPLGAIAKAQGPTIQGNLPHIPAARHPASNSNWHALYSPGAVAASPNPGLARWID